MERDKEPEEAEGATRGHYTRRRTGLAHKEPQSWTSLGPPRWEELLRVLQYQG